MDTPPLACPAGVVWVSTARQPRTSGADKRGRQQWGSGQETDFQPSTVSSLPVLKAIVAPQANDVESTGSRVLMWFLPGIIYNLWYFWDFWEGETKNHCFSPFPQYT